MTDLDTGLTRLRREARARRNLRPLVLGQAISLLGDYVAYITLPLFIVFLTGSALDLGLITASETLPMLLFGVAAGVLLDRIRIRRSLVFADLARAAAFLALAFGVSVDRVDPWMVFVAAFTVGSMSVVFDSGLQALMPVALNDALLVTANTWLQFARTAAFTIGPAIGGLLVARQDGFEIAFALNALTFLASAVFLTMVRTDEPKAGKVRKESFVSQVRSGLGALLSDARLRWATLGGAVTNFVFAPLEALLPLFVTVRLAGRVTPPDWLAWAFTGAAEVGVFFAIQAAIGSIGVAVAPRLARSMPLGRMFILGLSMLGGGFLIVSFSRSFWAVLAAGASLAGVGWVQVALVTMRQRLAPPDMLGRVVAASRTIAWVGLPAGAALGGALADSVGLVPVYLAGSIGVLAVATALSVTPLWGLASADRTARGSDGDSPLSRDTALPAPGRPVPSSDASIPPLEDVAGEPNGGVRSG